MSFSALLPALILASDRGGVGLRGDWRVQAETGEHATTDPGPDFAVDFAVDAAKQFLIPFDGVERRRRRLAKLGRRGEFSFLGNQKRGREVP